MLERMILGLLRRRLSEFPAVALVGPRQCGKTTLARALAGHYFDLEQPGERVRLDLTLDRLAEGSKLIVLDEAQTWPAVFPRLRGLIDARRKVNGRFLLLGSVSPALMREVGESLAGRLALVPLTPLLPEEVGRERLDRLWRFGGFPDGGVLRETAFPAWQENYLAAMAQRDLPNWGLPARPVWTERLFRMLAAEQGATVNWSRLGQSLGVSYHTVQSYMEHLEGAYLIRLLPPFARNLRKRLVKAPRVYWRDSGLLHALLQLRPGDDLWSRPWVGASWEGFVIEQILNTRAARGEAVNLKTAVGRLAKEGKSLV
ncbi:MAG: ATP-binding protein [Limisphaerales bacterium]